MTDQDLSKSLQDRIAQAYSERTPLQIKAGNSKAFYGPDIDVPVLNVASHRGILNYEPTELILTARAGTPLTEIEQTLAEQNQMLPFEPPHFGPAATLGGTIACGLSGPRRPWTGSVRDFVLGVKIINGKAEMISFGGEVMKNVAGYDVSRLMTGAMGTLGVLLEVSLKVLPKPAAEITLSREIDARQALQHMLQFAQQALPLSALCHDGRKMYLRLSGAEQSVRVAKQQLGGVELDDGQAFWQGVREQTLPFFTTDESLWRISLPAATPLAAIKGTQFIDWGGAQRWLKSELDAHTLRTRLNELNGHATLFRNGDRSQEIFHPLSGKLKQLHIDLKLAFDPHCILNPTRMYSDF